MNPALVFFETILNSRYRLIHHGIFISLIVFFWLLFSLNELNRFTGFVSAILYALTYIAVTYFNIYFLFKRYLLNGKLVMYVVLSLITFFFSYVIQHFIYFHSWMDFRKQLTPSPRMLSDMTINFISYTMFIGVGLSVKMIKSWVSSETKIIALEKENLKAQLSNLKSQLSPHFLFNTFNNLYVLTKTNPALASEMVLGFSDLMRYQLIECEKDSVDIQDEINYIENFLNLEKLRKDNLDITFVYNKSEIEGKKLEPLLFITLVENAVKHGSQQMQKAYIHLRMTCNGTKLCFEITNSKPLVPGTGKEKHTGKGLDNLKKRLALSYPHRHTLELTDQQTQYLAKLQIELA